MSTKCLSDKCFATERRGTAKVAAVIVDAGDSGSKGITYAGIQEETKEIQKH